MIFKNPYWLLLLIMIPPLIWWLRRHKTVAIRYSSTQHLKRLKDTIGERLFQCVFWLKIMVLILFIVALARPQLTSLHENTKVKGIDIMLVTDVSDSMGAEDFKPKNRLVVAKKTIQEFIKKRQGDHIGLIVFGGTAFTYCPLTVDYGALENFVDELSISMAGGGTAIGMAIATGVNRLKSSSSKSKIMILLTDGENTTGQIDPISAAELGKKLGIKIYTIGIGKEGGAPIPYIHPKVGKTYYRNPDGSLFLTRIDEELLKKIAKITNGQYFRATNTESLDRIYELIDQLEKTEKKLTQYREYNDIFSWFLSVAFLCICGIIVIQFWILRAVP